MKQQEKRGFALSEQTHWRRSARTKTLQAEEMLARTIELANSDEALDEGAVRLGGGNPERLHFFNDGSLRESGVSIARAVPCSCRRPTKTPNPLPHPFVWKARNAVCIDEVLVHLSRQRAACAAHKLVDNACAQRQWQQ